MRILRPQEIPRYVAEGLFDLGITGRDWIEETGSDVVSLCQLHYSKATARPVQIVVAVHADSGVERVEDLKPGARVSTEFPELTRRFFAQHGLDVDIRLSYGATEAKVPDIVDAIVELTETGSALRAAGLRIIDTILVSFTELIANPAAYDDPAKRHAMSQIQTLLEGTLEARGRVLVKLNVAEADLDGVIEILPCDEVADRVEAVRRGRLRGRDGRAEVRHQHAHPRAEGPRRHRHHRAADLQDRPLTGSARGRRRRVRRDRGHRLRRGRRRTRWFFHCTQIADGTPHDRGRDAPVNFEVRPGHLGALGGGASSPVVAAYDKSGVSRRPPS